MSNVVIQVNLEDTTSWDFKDFIEILLSQQSRKPKKPIRDLEILKERFTFQKYSWYQIIKSNYLSGFTRCLIPDSVGFGVRS